MANRNQPSNGRYSNSNQRSYLAGNQASSYGSMRAVPMGNVREAAEEICNPLAEKDPLAGLPLAMAYVPWQRFENIYCLKDAFMKGTMFQDLDFDFYGRRCN